METISTNTISFFNQSSQVAKISKTNKFENEMRMQWLDGEFEKLTEKISTLSEYFEDNGYDPFSHGRKKLHDLLKLLRLIDNKFVEVDYLDQTNKIIALDDIEEEVRDLKKQLSFIQENYLIH